MKTIKVSILVYILLVICSCKKFDNRPLNQYSDGTVWTDSILVNAFLGGVYRKLPSEYDNADNLLSSYTDETEPYQFSPVYQFNQTAAATTLSSTPLDRFWASSYASIRQCNVFLENIDRLKIDTKKKDQMIAEVRFLRALFYHYLHNYFGRFPIITRIYGIKEDLFIPRAPDADCLNFITSELKAAAADLPLKYPADQVGRATKGAALSLLSRVYLYEGQWQKAADAARSVIDLNIYSLFPDYSGLFHSANDNNDEVILEKSYIKSDASQLASDVDSKLLPPNYTGTTYLSAGNYPNGKLVDAYEMKDGSSFSWKDSIYAKSPWANRDPRLEASIVCDGSTLFGKIVDMKPGSIFNPTTIPSATNYYIKKFLDPDYNIEDVTSKSGQNFIIIRYAEVLLNYAEAEYNLGNKEEARKYVNMIRARPSVNMPPIDAGNFTMESIRHERFVELAFEGLRLWDINRWKIGQQARGANSITSVEITGSGEPGKRIYKPSVPDPDPKRVFAERMYLFPIPVVEIQKYPANKPLVQNPGW